MIKNLIQTFGYGLLRLISRTWRIRVENPPADGPAIITFWHGYMMPVWRHFAHRNASAVVSLSKDGQFLSDLLERWDFDLIRGSSSRGGGEVLRRIVSKLNSNIVLMTPDGPRGPRYEFKVGAIVAAQRTERPVYYCGVDIKGYKSFSKSWDKFLFPRPFARIELRFSEAQFFSRELSRDDITALASESSEKLNALYTKLL